MIRLLPCRMVLKLRPLQKVFLVAAFQKNKNRHLAHYMVSSFIQKCITPLKEKKSSATFLVNICACSQDWTPASFVHETVEDLKKQIGDQSRNYGA